MPTDQSDPVAVLREALGRLYANREGYEIQRASYEAAEMAIAELERRQGREKRLEALVRRTVDAFAQYEGSGMLGHLTTGIAGLVEAARKELEDG
jgi:hypothetical protein